MFNDAAQILVPVIAILVGVIIKLIMRIQTDMDHLRDELISRMENLRSEYDSQMARKVFEQTCRERQQACLRLVSDKLDDIRSEQRRLWDMFQGHVHDANGTMVIRGGK